MKSSAAGAVVTGLTYGADLQYRVRAVANAGYGASEWSSVKTFTVCPMDIDNDGDVAGTDRNWLSRSWLSSEGEEEYQYFCDIDGDGDVAGTDRNFLARNWLNTVGEDEMVYPKPIASSADTLFEELGNFESGNLDDLFEDLF